MSFLSELEAFQKTHPFQNTKVNGIEADYLLYGNPGSKYTLVYLVGGTGLSVALVSSHPGDGKRLPHSDI